MKKLCVMLCVLCNIYSAAPGTAVDRARADIRYGMYYRTASQTSKPVNSQSKRISSNEIDNYKEIEKNYLERIKIAFDIETRHLSGKLADMLDITDTWMRNICKAMQISSDHILEIVQIGEDLKNTRAVELIEFIKQKDKARCER